MEEAYLISQFVIIKKTSENIRKIATCQKDNYTADSLL